MRDDEDCCDSCANEGEVLQGFRGKRTWEEVRYLCKLDSGLVGEATTAPLPSRNTGGLLSTPWLYSVRVIGSIARSTVSLAEPT